MDLDRTIIRNLSEVGNEKGLSFKIVNPNELKTLVNNANALGYSTIEIDEHGQAYAVVTSTDVIALSTSKFKVKQAEFLFMTSLFSSINMQDLDTSETVIMANMFWRTRAKKIDIGNIDTSKVKGMGMMFSGIDVDKLDLSNLNTVNVIDMQGMFFSSNINILDIHTFDVSNTIKFSEMFNEATIGTLKMCPISLDKSIKTGIFSSATIDTLDMQAVDFKNSGLVEKDFNECNIWEIVVRREYESLARKMFKSKAVTVTAV